MVGLKIIYCSIISLPEASNNFCIWSRKKRASCIMPCLVGAANHMATSHDYNSPYLKTGKYVHQAFHRTSSPGKGLLFASNAQTKGDNCDNLAACFSRLTVT